MKILDRQYPLAALVEITPELAAGGTFTVSMLPGTWVSAMTAITTVAFAAGTLTLSDGTTTFISAEALTAAGSIAVDAQTKYFPAGAVLTGTIAGAATAVTGHALVRIDYVMRGRGNEVAQ